MRATDEEVSLVSFVLVCSEASVFVLLILGVGIPPLATSIAAAQSARNSLPPVLETL